MKREQARRLIEALNPTGVPILGFLCWWDLEGVELSAEDFRDKWEEAGLPTGLCMHVRSRTALVKALKELERGKMVRKIIDDETQIVYAIVREDVDYKERDVDYEKENRVIYDKITKEMEFRVEGELPDQIRTAFSRYEGQYTSREVRKVTTHAVKHYGGITVRRAGGTYLMVNAKAVAKLRLLYDNLPGTIHQFVAYSILDAPEFKKQLLIQVREELLGDLKKAKITTNKMLELAEKGRVRPKSLETQLDKLEKLRKKVDSFEAVGLDKTEFYDKLDKNKRKVDKSLKQLEAS